GVRAAFLLRAVPRQPAARGFWIRRHADSVDHSTKSGCQEQGRGQRAEGKRRGGGQRAKVKGQGCRARETQRARASGAQGIGRPATAARAVTLLYFPQI